MLDTIYLFDLRVPFYILAAYFSLEDSLMLLRIFYSILSVCFVELRIVLVFTLLLTSFLKIALDWLSYCVLEIWYFYEDISIELVFIVAVFVDVLLLITIKFYSNVLIKCFFLLKTMWILVLLVENTTECAVSASLILVLCCSYCFIIRKYILLFILLNISLLFSGDSDIIKTMPTDQ